MFFVIRQVSQANGSCQLLSSSGPFNVGAIHIGNYGCSISTSSGATYVSSGCPLISSSNNGNVYVLTFVLYHSSGSLYGYWKANGVKGTVTQVTTNVTLPLLVNKWNFGGWDNDSSRSFGGHLAEFMYYNSLLSDANISYIESYLISKWNIYAIVYFNGCSLYNYGSKTGITLTLNTGTATPSVTAGKSVNSFIGSNNGFSYYFPAGSYGTISNIVMSNTSSHSISLWFWCPGIVGYGRIISFGVNGYGLQLYGGSGTNAYIHDGYINTTLITFSTTSWNHFVYTFYKNGSNITVIYYLNNVKYTNTITSSTIPYNGNTTLTCLFNYYFDNTGNGQNVYIGDFRVYDNYILTDSDVSTIYNIPRTE